MGSFSRPFGTYATPISLPNVETLGYCHDVPPGRQRVVAAVLLQSRGQNPNRFANPILSRLPPGQREIDLALEGIDLGDLDFHFIAEFKDPPRAAAHELAARGIELIEVVA